MSKCWIFKTDLKRDTRRNEIQNKPEGTRSHTHIKMMSWVARCSKNWSQINHYLRWWRQFTKQHLNTSQNVFKFSITTGYWWSHFPGHIKLFKVWMVFDFHSLTLHLSLLPQPASNQFCFFLFEYGAFTYLEIAPKYESELWRSTILFLRPWLINFDVPC